MLPALDTLIAPIINLSPLPAKSGHHPLSGIDRDDLLRDDLTTLPMLVDSALQGLAGDAILSSLAIAGGDTGELLTLSVELNELAENGVAAVTQAIRDVTAIAAQCSREALTLMSTSALNPAVGPALAHLGWFHLERAGQRISELETELNSLAARVDEITIATPAAPPVPGAPIAAAADTSPVPSVSAVAPAVATAGAPSTQAAAAVTAAHQALGTPYVWGGTQPGVGVDCSGLTQWAYGQAGVEIPRTASEQAVGPQVPADQIAPGDLAVWDGHVAMIAEDGMMIEAGDPVQLSPVRTENIGMGFHGFYRPTG